MSNISLDQFTLENTSLAINHSGPVYKSTVIWGADGHMLNTEFDAERKAYCLQMFNEGHVAKPPVINSPTSGSRFWTSEGAANNYVTEMQQLAQKYNLEIVETMVVLEQ